MPKRVYVPKTTGRRKKYRKGKKYSYPARWAAPRSLVPSADAGPGTRLSAKLIYCEKDFNINPAAGLCGVYQFNLSSLFDPNFTGVGHQPTGFDQLMAIYEEYLVTYVSVRAVFSNTGSSGASGLMVGMTANDSTSTSADCRQYIENGNTVWSVITSPPDSAPIAHLSMNVSLPQAHGVTMSQFLGEDQYRGTSTSNPNENIYLTLWAQDITVAGDPPGCNVAVEITYWARFLGGKLNSLS